VATRTGRAPEQPRLVANGRQPIRQELDDQRPARVATCIPVGVRNASGTNHQRLAADLVPRVADRLVETAIETEGEARELVRVRRHGQSRRPPRPSRAQTTVRDLPAPGNGSTATRWPASRLRLSLVPNAKGMQDRAGPGR
jgi:hypothetical protein